MFDALLPFRLVRSSSEFAMQNISIGLGLWSTAASQTAAMMSSAADAAMPRTHGSRGKSWYRAPDQSEPSFGLLPWGQFNPMSVMLDSMRGAGARDVFFGLPSAPALLPWQQALLSWQGLFPQPLSARAWPVACFLVAAGMPIKAAWPAAEASVHAIEATMKAAEGVQEIFSAYRSQGGHAAAQIIRPRRLH